MPTYLLGITRGLSSLVVLLLLAACGGGGGGGETPPQPSPTGPPFIAAELDSFPTGSVPTGFNRGASVAVLDDSTGASITTATVVMNGVTLTYDVTNQDYEGNVVVAPGGAVTLSVAVGGSTYTASTTQFTSYPTVSAPASGATWDSSIANTVTWSGGAPTTNAVYGFGVLDAADPNTLIWPLDHFFQEVPIGTTSSSIPAFSITAGNRLVVVGIARSGVAIPNAASGSSLVVVGVNYVPITVPGMPVTSRMSGTTNSLSGVAWSGTQFVAVGNSGIILTSPDGITWTSRTSGTTNPLYGVNWSGTQFVAVGGNGTTLTSPNGITWTARTSGTTNILRSVVWSGTLFVAVGGSGAILTSPDGVTWTARTSGTTELLNGVTWSGTQFVAVGGNGLGGLPGTVLASPDGVTWTSGSGNLNLNYPQAVTWSGTQFVAAGFVGLGAHGLILGSPNGVTWGAIFLAGSSLFDNLFGIVWSGTQFVAVGGSGNTGTILTSPDGGTWTRQPSGTTNTLSGVVWSGTKFVIVGANGTILTSP